MDYDFYFEIRNISREIPAHVYRQNDHYSNWHCLDCGTTGKAKACYNSTLLERRRAHLNQRCKAR